MRVVAKRRLFVRRRLLNADEFRAWARSQGFGTTLPPEDLHVTVAYSREVLPPGRPPPDGDPATVPPSPDRSVEALGDEGAVVLRFQDPHLERRWRAHVRAGATWDYPAYLPHVTVTYAAPAGLDLAAVEPFAGELRFGPEEREVKVRPFSPPVEKSRRSVPVAKVDPARARRARRLGRSDGRRSDLIAVRELDAASKSLEPRVARAFRAAATAARDAAPVRAMARAIERGDLEGAVRLAEAETLAARLRGAGLEPGAASLVDELVETFRVGGDAALRQLPRELALRGSLDLTNPEAIDYLRRSLPTRLREVSDETREAVRSAVLRGFREGRPAREIAREARGAIGLTRAQSGYVANFRRQLETGELGGATPPWERRLSASERARARRLFEARRPSRRKIDQIVARYERSLVNRRARNVARTEVTRAFGAGQAELWRQADESGLFEGQRVRRRWVVTPDDRLREDHAAVPGMNPDGVGLEEPFQTPVGPVMRPRESGNGAFDVSCRCTEALDLEETSRAS